IRVQHGHLPLSCCYYPGVFMPHMGNVVHQVHIFPAALANKVNAFPPDDLKRLFIAQAQALSQMCFSKIYLLLLGRTFMRLPVQYRKKPAGIRKELLIDRSLFITTGFSLALRFWFYQTELQK